MKVRVKELKSKRVKVGFSLIEMLIVLSILGMAATLVSTSYRSFEKRQRVKEAALEMKNQIRAVQNKALSGDKGIPGEIEGFCNTQKGEILLGWYLSVSKNEPSYEIWGDCLKSSGETKFGKKTINLPDEVKIEEITYKLSPAESKQSANILYRPLEHDVRFFETSTPPFINPSTGKFISLFGNSENQESVVVKVSGSNSAWEVTVRPTGEVNEKEI